MINGSPRVLSQCKLAQEIQGSPSVQAQQHLAAEINHDISTEQAAVAQPQVLEDEFRAQGETELSLTPAAQLELEPDQLAAATAQNRSSAGSFAPVQRKIELHDRDEGTYRETEDGKAASGAGDLYFAETYHKALPVFVNAEKVNSVITFVEDAMAINEKTEDETYYKELDKGIKSLGGGINEALGGAVFYTDDAVVTKEIPFPSHSLTQALRKPLLRDPAADS
jgi:hypothetical protein